MNLNNKEKIIFLVLVLSLSFSLFSLVDYIRLSFNIENNRDGMIGSDSSGTEPPPPPAFDPSNTRSNIIGSTIYGGKLWNHTYTTPEERQADLDPNCSYENQLRGARQFTRVGSWDGLTTNTNAFKDQVTGFISNDYKLSKTRNGIGISLPMWTNSICQDTDGNDHDLYTMNYTLSNEKNGLIGNLINSISETGQALQDFSTDNQDGPDPCVLKKVKIVTCSSKEGSGNVHLKQSEINKLQELDNSPIEAFKNIDELLANDKLFYKDYFIFIYFFMLTLLFLYYILIIVINNN